MCPAAAGPNPSRGPLRVSAAGAPEARVEIVDALGRVVRVLHSGWLGGEGTWEVGALAPGVYRVRASGAAGVASEAFTVAR